MTSKEVIEIRRYAFDYLNNLEIILLSWRDNIVDQNLIFEQFYPLVSNKKCFPVTLFQDNFSEEIDQACNSDDNCPKPPKSVCPAITNFYNYCENKIKLADKKIDECNSQLELKWCLKEVMANRQINKINLNQKTQLGLHNLLSLENNLPHPINTQEIERLCIALKCQPGDLLKLVSKSDINT
ncbi:MAG: helix-turn-helix transcriptional regulator [Xenococcaceae cyanobacterium MO_167.B52]|nr:helix-turn-helix transcriptional regulator [Xenococcaceae cyanobacterium MO_167.B52]